MEQQVKCFGPMVQISDDRCIWQPVIRPSRRVSSMFHVTTCGKSGAALLKDSGWSHCPFCGNQLLVIDPTQDSASRDQEQT